MSFTTRRERVRKLKAANDAPSNTGAPKTPMERLAAIAKSAIESANVDTGDDYYLFWNWPSGYFARVFSLKELHEYRDPDSTTKLHPETGRSFKRFHSGRKEWYVHGVLVKSEDSARDTYLEAPGAYFLVYGEKTASDPRIEYYDRAHDRRYTIFENGNKEWRENGRLVKMYESSTKRYYDCE